MSHINTGKIRKWTAAPENEHPQSEPTKPNHYKTNSGNQAWDLMRDFGTHEELVGFLKLNIIKYLQRYNKKTEKTLQYA